MNKYNAIKTVKAGTTFDSKFEAKVFEEIRNATYLNTDLSMKIKPGVMIKPATKFFPERHWKCDFRVEHERWGWLNVEAKGLETREFRLDLEMLEINNPDEFDRLIVVVPVLGESRLDSLIKAGKVWTLSSLYRKITDERYWTTTERPA